MLFDVRSTGRVVGVRADSGGRAFVVKMLPARWTPAFLSAVQRVQRALRDKGFPCPEPLGVLGSTLFESLLPDLGMTRPAPSLLGASAAGLCRQIVLADGVDGDGLDPHPLGDVEGRLYPEPHSDLFDFEATADGAEWIDELAASSKAQRQAGGPVVIAHTDWSARNVRLSAAGAVAVYDWDSLALVPEAQAVGQAAATWSATGEGDPNEAAPTVEEVAAYVRAYQQARGRRFTRAEWGVAGASVVWALAYTARCEHSVDPEERVHRRARSRLRADAARLLALSSEL